MQLQIAAATLRIQTRLRLLPNYFGFSCCYCRCFHKKFLFFPCLSLYEISRKLINGFG